MTSELPTRCGCCNREGCLRDRLPSLPIDAVLKAPSAEHCAVIRYADEVWKFVKCTQPGWMRAHFDQCSAFAAEHPRWFAPLKLDHQLMIVKQPFIPGRHATNEEANGLIIALADAGIGNVHDVVGHNIIVSDPDSRFAGRPLIIDFGISRGGGRCCWSRNAPTNTSTGR